MGKTNPRSGKSLFDAQRSKTCLRLRRLFTHRATERRDPPPTFVFSHRATERRDPLIRLHHLDERLLARPPADCFIPHLHLGGMFQRTIGFIRFLPSFCFSKSLRLLVKWCRGGKNSDPMQWGRPAASRQLHCHRHGRCSRLRPQIVGRPGLETVFAGPHSAPHEAVGSQGGLPDF